MTPLIILPHKIYFSCIWIKFESSSYYFFSLSSWTVHEISSELKHLNNIFEREELIGDSVISILETTATDGKNYKTRNYNLNAIISVGYRVNSSKATQFRIWATKLLKEYMIKGFVLDDKRLKNVNRFFTQPFRFPM